MTLKRLRGKKALFLKAWIQTFGNVTQSCKMAEINRTTYYLWMKEDYNFKLNIESEDVVEAEKDMIESKLRKLALQEDKTILIFMAKTKCKDRGYVERYDFDHTTKGESLTSLGSLSTEELIERAKAAKNLES